MNQEAVLRIKKALEYKKMAIHALFPKQTVKHLEVIEQEVSAIVKEFMMNATQSEKSEKKDENSKTSKVKKVNIN